MASVSRPVKEGWLLKEGGAARNKWQSRWFVLKGDTLYYYMKSDDQSNPLGTIKLTQADNISRIGDHSGRPHCIAIVGMKGSGKKVYYLSSDYCDVLTEWYSALNAAASSRNLKLTKYCTAEVFLNQGIRVNGDVCYQILSSLSMRTAPEKKSRDSLGWFCHREVALSTVLNLFAQYNWIPEKIYRSSAVIPTESGIHPVIRVIFSKSPSVMESPMRGAPVNYHVPPLEKSVEGVATLSSLGGDLLEGADDELIGLMQEFNIPLNLLQIGSSE